SHISFCFQAEDGIRESTVTGVQTCALPIWRFQLQPRVPNVTQPLIPVLLQATPEQDAHVLGRSFGQRVPIRLPRQHRRDEVRKRSEESRGGRECRSSGGTGECEYED